MLSCDILGLLQIAVDFSSNFIVYELSRETLMKVIRNATAQKLIPSCIQALSLMNYICESQDEDTDEILELFREILIEHKNVEITTKAIVGWCMITSLLPTYKIDTEG